MTRVNTVIIQSTFDFAIREINALEQRIVQAEDDADAMLWGQADQVVAQLKAGLSQVKLAEQWINVRLDAPYSRRHVQIVAELAGCYLNSSPRPNFREAYNAIANAKTKLSVHHSSETDEHYTPAEIIAVVVACLESIDLDPCSNSDEPPNVPARVHYTEADNGLEQPWHGRVYMNPPYGQTIDQWVKKLTDEHEHGEVIEAIALLPARPDTQWFHRLRDYACCFIEGRLTFLGNDDPAPFPSAVFYLGEDLSKFYHHFADLGDIWQRIEPGMFGE
jgi:DNA N-6-adenine-methyltransferase (Dam)